jgi:hypothetical protein
MTSISAPSSNSYQSPLQKLQDALQSEVNSGAIGSSDQSALSSALSDIDQGMRSGKSSGGRASPDALKSKIDDLIQNEVSAGKLTSDQATELQGVFKAAFANGPGDASGLGGTCGPPPGPPPSGGPSLTDGTASSSKDNSAADLLQQFLESLKSSSSSSTGYSATGSSGSSSSSGSLSALLIDYQS